MRLLTFDFRTKIIIFLCTLILVKYITLDILFYVLLSLLIMYLVIQGYTKTMMKCVVVCAAAIFIRYFTEGQGWTVLIPDFFLFLITRITAILMSCVPIFKMSPGEIVAVFKKIHAPNCVSLPITFMLRFFPTIHNEFSDVFASIRLRGLNSWKNPLKTMEYLFVPVMFRSSRIADELAASSETRGLSNPGLHTSRREIKLCLQDYLCSFLAVFLMLSILMLERRA